MTAPKAPTPTRVVSSRLVGSGAPDLFYVGRPRDARGRPSTVIPEPPWRGALASPFDPRTYGAELAQRMFERYFLERVTEGTAAFDRAYRACAMSAGGLRLTCDCDAIADPATAHLCTGWVIARWVDGERAKVRGASEQAAPEVLL